MKVTFWVEAWDRYAWWQANDRNTVKRINALIADIMRNGHEGIGKPEPLRGDLSGFWSRRADQSTVWSIAWSTTACRRWPVAITTAAERAFDLFLIYEYVPRQVGADSSVMRRLTLSIIAMWIMASELAGWVS